jgi:hypothetical protein
MLKAVKRSVSKMTSHLQLITGYLEVHDYAKALVKTRESIKELHALATSLTVLSDLGMTVPEGGGCSSAWFHSGEPRRRECGR